MRGYLWQGMEWNGLPLSAGSVQFHGTGIPVAIGFGLQQLIERVGFPFIDGAEIYGIANDHKFLHGDMGDFFRPVPSVCT